MMNPALPATMRTADGELVTDIEPGRLTCYGCGKVIFNSRTCVQTGARLFCEEECANRTAIRRLRRVGRALPY